MEILMEFDLWFDKEYPEATWNMPLIMREAFREIASKAWEAGADYQYELMKDH
jgi:hypothetical protein